MDVHVFENLSSSHVLLPSTLVSYPSLSSSLAPLAVTDIILTITT